MAATTSMIAATDWIEGSLVGPIGTAVAVIAVAGIGLLSLQGRIPARRALSVVVGCCLVFGAPTIAAGLLGSTAEPAVETPPPPAIEPPTPRPIGPQTNQPFDPYAGASVPQRKSEPFVIR